MACRQQRHFKINKRTKLESRSDKQNQQTKNLQNIYKNEEYKKYDINVFDVK